VCKLRPESIDVGVNLRSELNSASNQCKKNKKKDDEIKFARVHLQKRSYPVLDVNMMASLLKLFVV